MPAAGEKHSNSISAVIGDAETLPLAVAALMREYPELTVSGVIAAEKAEILEMGWAPSSQHSDCAYLLAIAAMVKPFYSTHGDLPLHQAMRLFVESELPHAREFAAALESEILGSAGR